MDLSRRQLIVLGASGALVTQAAAQRPALPPQIPIDEVRTFVGAGHNDFEKVRTMLEANPGLLNASYNLGGGDWESAIEAAGHVGNREICLYLIGQGARMSIFQHAMLGHLEIVQSIIRLHPAALKSKGPHGLDLMHHARKGGEQAKAVLEFLERESKG